MAAYEAALYAASRKMSARNLSDEKILRINRILMEQAIALNPHLFDWDCYMIPGWTGLFLFDTYANDLYWLGKAIAALENGQKSVCLKALENVTTMEWGQYVGDEARTTMMKHIAYNDHLLWGYGFIPMLTEVHPEYMSLMGRYGSNGMTKAQIIASLKDKHDAIYGYVTIASEEAGTAFSDAAEILRTM